MRPQFVERTMATMFDTMYVVREPYGIALLVAPFNYPISMVVLPLIALIAAGLLIFL